MKTRTSGLPACCGGLLVLVVVLARPTALAHQRLPAQLRLRPAGADAWSAELVVPVVNGQPLAVDLPPPAGCTAGPRQLLRLDARLRAVREVWTCSGADLWGARLEARGLGEADIDLLVLADLGDGTTASLRLDGATPGGSLPERRPSPLGLLGEGLLMALGRPLPLAALSALTALATRGAGPRPLVIGLVLGGLLGLTLGSVLPLGPGSVGTAAALLLLGVALEVGQPEAGPGAPPRRTAAWLLALGAGAGLGLPLGGAPAPTAAGLLLAQALFLGVVGVLLGVLPAPVRRSLGTLGSVLAGGLAGGLALSGLLGLAGAT